jgi:hypothetical protein
MQHLRSSRNQEQGEGVEPAQADPRLARNLTQIADGAIFAR